jgi:hypothetical protein
VGSMRGVRKQSWSMSKQQTPYSECIRSNFQLHVLCNVLMASFVSAFSRSRIIWLGDLNYRIALSYRSVKALVEMRNWKALLEKDQVRA